VIDEETASREEARVSKTSVCGSRGAIAGTLRYFADRFGVPRAAIEGTQIPRDLVRENALEHPDQIVFLPDRAQTPIARRRRVTYFGFDLEREDEPIREWPGDDAPRARAALADALARGAALHPAVRRHRPIIDEIREVWRRSGGTTPRLGHDELAALYAEALEGIDDVHQWRAAPLTIDWESVLPRAQREDWLALPGAAEVRGRALGIEYDVETDEHGATRGVARLRIPEKLARSLDDDDLPVLDRPLRLVVQRGPRGTVRANDLAELRQRLDEAPAGPVNQSDDAPRQRKGKGHHKGARKGPRGRPPWKGKRR
jgi:hypothetical protein